MREHHDELHVCSSEAAATGDSDDASYRRSHGGAADASHFPAFEVKHDPDRPPPRAAISPTLPRSKPRLLRRIVVAVDQSEQARWAVDVAARLAAALGAELAMVYVVDDMPFTSSAMGRRVCPSGEEQGAETLRELALRIPKGVGIVKVLRYGLPGREIVNAASEWDANLIVIGTHGRGNVSRFFRLLGGVAGHVLRYAECPVMTVSEQSAEASASDRFDTRWHEQAAAEELSAATPMCG